MHLSISTKPLWSARALLSKAAAEKMNKILQQQINEITSKLDEANRTLNDFDASKKKLTIENSEYSRQVCRSWKLESHSNPDFSETVI